MGRMFIYLIALVSGMILCGNHVVAASLSDLESQYAKDRESSAWKYVEKHNAARTSYTNALVALEAALKARGNLDGVLAARQERERVAAASDGKLPENQAIPEIMDLRARHRKVTQDIALDEKRAIVATTQQYVERLKALERELTVADKIDAAIVVQQKRKKVMDEPDVVAALAALREASTNTPPAASEPSKSNETTLPRIEFKKTGKGFADPAGSSGFGRTRNDVKSSFK